MDTRIYESIGIPREKDYKRLSSSPSRDLPAWDNDDYFERVSSEGRTEWDTPVKVAAKKLGKKEIEALNENLSSNLVDDIVPVASKIEEPAPVAKPRAPLKVIPSTKTAPAKAAPVVNETDGIDDLSRLALFVPKEPVRLNQRRRSEQKQREEQERKNAETKNVRPKSMIPARSSSLQRARTPSVTRPASASVSSEGPVTRSKARAAASSVAVATPSATSTKLAAPTKTTTAPAPPKRLSAVDKISSKMESLNLGPNRESRDRTRRSNTTATAVTTTTRPARPAPLKVAPTAARPPVTAPTAKPPITSSQTRPTALANRARVPLRVNSGTPSATTTSSSIRRSVPSAPSSIARKSGAAPAAAAAGPRVVGTPIQKAQPRRIDVDALVSRLSTPKNIAPPVRRSAIGSVTTSLKTDSVVTRPAGHRPVPSYLRSTNKNGQPTSAVSHGVRVPSRPSSRSRASSAKPTPTGSVVALNDQLEIGNNL